MTSVQTGDIPVNPQEAYGLGWIVKIRDDEGPSVGSYGHSGAHRTVMWVDPKNEFALVLLVERFDMTGDERKILYGSFFKARLQNLGRPAGNHDQEIAGRLRPNFSKLWKSARRLFPIIGRGRCGHFQGLQLLIVEHSSFESQPVLTAW